MNKFSGVEFMQKYDILIHLLPPKTALFEDKIVIYNLYLFNQRFAARYHSLIKLLYL
jgi:hypothetical protein